MGAERFVVYYVVLVISLPRHLLLRLRCLGPGLKGERFLLVSHGVERSGSLPFPFFSSSRFVLQAFGDTGYKPLVGVKLSVALRIRHPG